MPDVAGNQWLECKSNKIIAFKKQFIAYKGQLLFLKDFADFGEKFVHYVLDSLVFNSFGDTKTNKIFYTSISLYADSSSKTNQLPYILQSTNFALLKPNQIRMKLTEFIKLNSSPSIIYKSFINEIQIMINYYTILYMENRKIQRITKNIEIFKESGYLDQIIEFEKEVMSVGTYYEFLFNDKNLILKKIKEEKILKEIK